MRIKSSLGFSLLEVMVAVGILTFTIVTLLLGFITCNLSIQSNHNLLLASTYAQYILEHLRKMPFDEISNYTISEGLYNPFNITLKTNINNNLANITVNVSWYEGQKEKNFSLATYRHRIQ